MNQTRVDFTKDTMVGIAPLNIVKIGILEARENFILAYEDYSNIEEGQGTPSTRYIIARMRSWFLKMQAYLKRKFDEADYLLIRDTIMYDKNIELDTLLDLYYQLNQEMDAMGLTKIDTREVIDRTNVELVNRSHGL